MIVYQALYNPMVWESGYITLSIHLSKDGAEKSIAFHRENKKKEFESLYEGEEPPYKFGIFENWAVSELEVLD